MSPFRNTLVIGALLLAGCVKEAPPVASVANPPVTKLVDLPKPQAADVVRDTRTTFVGPFTELRVEVFGVEDMQRDIMTDGEGNFSFPLVGTIAAAGKTPAMIEGEIRAKLIGRYVRDPQVTVNYKSSANPLAVQAMSVTVDGQVNRAGAYPAVGRLTLMRAVAMAGGTAEFAKLEDVVIFRDVGDQKYVGLYNLEGIRRGNYPDPEVFPGDIVIVGDSPQRRMFQDILRVTPALLSPIVLLAREF